jgi:hypothetical protein
MLVRLGMSKLNLIIYCNFNHNTETRIYLSTLAPLQDPLNEKYPIVQLESLCRLLPRHRRPLPREMAGSVQLLPSVTCSFLHSLVGSVFL